MEYRVIKGLCSPFDAEKKAGRRAVIIREFSDYYYMAPATTYFSRTGTVPIGSALLTNKSEAYKGSGFDKPEILISVRDAFLIAKNSLWLSKMEFIGVLNAKKDLRFQDNMTELQKKFPPAKIVEG